MNTFSQQIAMYMFILALLLKTFLKIVEAQLKNLLNFDVCGV